MGHCGDLVSLPVEGIDAVRHVLAQQPVEMSVTAALPRALGLVEVDRSGGRRAEQGMR